MNDADLIAAARAFAIERHAGIFRLNVAREPYAVHVIEVGRLVELSGGSAAEIAAGFLHDTVEDTKTTVLEIRAKFGDEVADIVDGLTDPREFYGMPTLERKTLQARRVRDKSDSVKRCKMADGTSNMRSCAEDPPESWGGQKCREYVEGARLVADACAGVSAYLDEEFQKAYAGALALIERRFPVVV